MLGDNADNQTDAARGRLNRARAYCAGGERCRSAVRRKLQDWGATADEADDTVERLVEEGYIDDQRYARAYCESKMLRGGWGAKKVRYELQIKHLAPADIAAGIAAVDEEERRGALLREAEKKAASLRGTDSDTMRRRLMAFLLQRGFETEEINNIIKQINTL